MGTGHREAQSHDDTVAEVVRSRCLTVKLLRTNATLVVIDVQERLTPVIDGADAMIANIDRLVRGAHVLGVPVVLTEQYVRGLGPTTGIVRRALEETSGYDPIEKLRFSACGAPPFAERLAASERRQILLAGVETHVCVYQTATDLLSAGYDVHLIADAVSSRTPSNKEIAIRRLLSEGAKLSSTEMALFELTGVSGTDEFRSIARLVK